MTLNSGLARDRAVDQPGVGKPGLQPAVTMETAGSPKFSENPSDQGLKRRERPALVVVLVRREICELLEMEMGGCRGGPRRQVGLSSQTVSSGGQ